jgi:hypothetical protein
MKLIPLILTAASCVGSIWFGRLTYLAGQHTGTGYLGEFISYGILTAVCILAAIGFGIWLYFS